MTEQAGQPTPPAGGPPREGSGPQGSPESSGRERGPRAEASGRSRGREGRRFFRRRKVCKFCSERIDYIDYKEVKLIVQFITDRGKIMPRRLTGVCSPHQRQLRVAIKRARNIALLPFAAAV